MSKSKKTNKVLVRNPSVPLRSRKVVEKTHELKKVHFVENVKEVEMDQTSLLSPEFCSLLQVADEIKSVRSTQGTSWKLPEMTSFRNLNFLPEEKIYQDLVGLEVSEEHFSEIKSQPPRVSVKKDPELNVNEYLKYTLQPEFFFSSCAVPILKRQKPVFDGCLIYKKLKTWKEQMS